MCVLSVVVEVVVILFLSTPLFLTSLLLLLPFPRTVHRLQGSTSLTGMGLLVGCIVVFTKAGGLIRGRHDCLLGKVKGLVKARASETPTYCKWAGPWQGAVQESAAQSCGVGRMPASVAGVPQARLERAWLF